MSVPPYKTGKVAQGMGQRNAAADELDITFVDEDGNLWHAWYRGKAGGWIGCEKIAGP